MQAHQGCQVPFRPPIPNVGLLLRRCSGKGLHLAMTGESCGISRVATGFSSYDGEIRDASCVGPGKSNLPFELRRKAGDCSRVTAGPVDLSRLVSRRQCSSPGATAISGLYSRRTRGDKLSSRVEAKNPALLSSRDGYLLELTGWTKGSQAS